jgi:hypothetical protein
MPVVCNRDLNESYPRHETTYEAMSLGHTYQYIDNIAFHQSEVAGIGRDLRTA